MISHIISFSGFAGAFAFLFCSLKHYKKDRRKIPEPNFIGGQLCLALGLIGMLLNPTSLEHPDIWFFWLLFMVMLVLYGVYRSYRSLYAKRDIA
jgi:hypothetical protein